MQRRTEYVVFGLAIALGVALTVFLRDSGKTLPFDQMVWESSELSERSARVPMARSLVRNHTLRRKTRAEVTSLLGEPIPAEQFPGWSVVYYLGADPDDHMPTVDPTWLAIRFDKGGYVETYRLITD
jgi:hypothetical protein